MASTLSLTGTWSQDGKIIANNLHGDSLTGTISGNLLTGVLSHGGNLANVAGQSIAAGQTASFCGTYAGDDGGTWNLVVSKNGTVNGAFDLGTMQGSAAGQNVTLSWTGNYFGTQFAGSASGTIDSSGSLSGSWTGSGSGTKVSGTWSSSAGCGGSPSPTPATAGQECSCAVNGCCPLSSGGEECCLP